MAQSYPDLLEKVRREGEVNSALYSAFLGAEYDSQRRRYLDGKEWDLDICDVVPKMVANSLGVRLCVVDMEGKNLVEYTPEMSSSPSINHDVPIVYVHRDASGTHYSGMC